MKILTATRDAQSSAVIIAAARLRWPDSGEVIVLPKMDDVSNLDLTDVDLGIVDGDLKRTAVRIIAAIRGSSGMPILFVADPRGDQMDTAWALSFRNVDYLFKPLEIEDLISRIEALTGSSKTLPDSFTPVLVIGGLEDRN